MNLHFFLQMKAGCLRLEDPNLYVSLGRNCVFQAVKSFGVPSVHLLTS